MPRFLKRRWVCFFPAKGDMGHFKMPATSRLRRMVPSFVDRCLISFALLFFRIRLEGDSGGDGLRGHQGRHRAGRHPLGGPPESHLRHPGRHRGHYSSTVRALATERAASWLSKHFTYWWLEKHGYGRVLIDSDGLRLQLWVGIPVVGGRRGRAGRVEDPGGHPTT